MHTYAHVYVSPLEPLVIRPKGNNTACPRDDRDGRTYVDCLDEEDASTATHMLSYTWGYKTVAGHN